jgi:hypothetical protein
VTAAGVDLLEGLQNWYASQCNGCWEHTYGISITTLDNPGWRLKVDLIDTDLIDRTFDEIIFAGKDEDDWYQCRVQNGNFEGPCGPARLSEVIAIFLKWSAGSLD